MRRRKKAEVDMNGPEPLKLYEVEFRAVSTGTALILARSEDEAMDLCTEPDDPAWDDPDWDCEGASEVSPKEFKQLLAREPDRVVGRLLGTGVTDGKDITLKLWDKYGDKIEEAERKQAEFDALPKLFPDVNPKVIIDPLVLEEE